MGNTNTSQKGKTCYSICFENPTPGNDNAANSYDPNYVPQNQSQNQNGFARTRGPRTRGPGEDVQYTRMDLHQILLEIKIKIKAFKRQAEEAFEDKEKQLAEAKEHLIEANKLRARVCCQEANQKNNENRQMQGFLDFFEVLQVQIVSNTITDDMIRELNHMRPILQMSTDEIPLDQMTKVCAHFRRTYAGLDALGQEFYNGMQEIFEEQTKQDAANNVENMMNSIKSEISLNDFELQEIIPAEQKQQKKKQAILA